MLIVGLTGGLATGKSTVAGMFAAIDEYGKKGIKIIDADAIVHQLLSRTGHCFNPIKKKFGQEILSGGHIDRMKLAEIVFKNREKLRQLNQIIHPIVKKEIVKRIKRYKKGSKQGIVIIDVPLLFESGLNKYVDISIVVKASRAEQIKRANKHLKITQAQALNRIKAQMPLQEKIRLGDIIIDNNRSLSGTKKQVKQIRKQLLGG